MFFPSSYFGVFHFSILRFCVNSVVTRCDRTFRFSTQMLKYYPTYSSPHRTKCASTHYFLLSFDWCYIRTWGGAFILGQIRTCAAQSEKKISDLNLNCLHLYPAALDLSSISRIWVLPHTCIVYFSGMILHKNMFASLRRWSRRTPLIANVRNHSIRYTHARTSTITTHSRFVNLRSMQYLSCEWKISAFRRLLFISG